MPTPDDRTTGVGGGRLSDEARELRRIITASVRDMLDACRIQAPARPVTDKALERIFFRAEHPTVVRLAPYPVGERAVSLPSIERLLLASALEAVANAEGTAEVSTQE